MTQIKITKSKTELVTEPKEAELDREIRDLVQGSIGRKRNVDTTDHLFYLIQKRAALLGPKKRISEFTKVRGLKKITENPLGLRVIGKRKALAALTKPTLSGSAGSRVSKRG